MADQLPEDSEPQGQVADEAGRFERDLRRQRPLLWAGTLLGPFVLTGIALGVLYVAHGASYVNRLLATAAATFFAFGKFVILAGREPDVSEIQRFFSPGDLFALVFYMDAMTAVLLVYHAGVLFRLPWIGKRIGGLVADGRFILASNPWMKRATFLGMVAFVMFPLAATGSVGGAIFGRLLGMTRRLALTAILIGSLLGCSLMYFGAGLISQFVDRDSPGLAVGGIVALAALILLLNLRYRRLKARQRAVPAVPERSRSADRPP